MRKLLSSREIIKTLEAHGFTLRSQKGSHTKYVFAGKVVIVPHPKKEIPYGTFLSIVRQSGLTKEEFYL